MKTKSLLAALSIAFWAAAISAAPLTYDVNRNIGNATVTGTVTTDGTLGNLSTSNVIDWTFTLDFGVGGSYALTKSAVSSALFTSGLSAEADSLSFDFSMPNVSFDFSNPFDGDSMGMSWSGSTNFEQVVIWELGYSEYSPRTGMVQIASRTIETNDVPEPASLGLVGLALLGVAASRRRA